MNIIDKILIEAQIGDVIDITPKMYDKKDKTFTLEASDADVGYPGIIVYLRNPKTGNKIRFKQFKKDTDGEDIFGWWYQSDDRQYKLLIIND